MSEALVSGRRIGPYEIVSAIGAGGMGEVFRARDTKLNRDVAIKVLPAAFADDPERLARFTREAQTLASLNHPNIAAIYGIEEVASAASSVDRQALTQGVGSGASRALVMELVEGEDLSSLISRGPIPIAEALPIARQIAEALEAAHEQGIVHRDLKPANIKIRSDGAVKVLDFGLAKAMDPAGASSSNPNVSHSPTLTHQGTMAGMIIGTAAYMSPEQAKGKAVDKRSDIWALGVVLYEMLTGKRAFKGEDVSETLAAVLMTRLPMDALPAATPPRLKRLIERCLERDLKMRLRDIGEARLKIARIEAGEPDSGAASPAIAAAAVAPVSRRAFPWAVGGIVGMALGALVFGLGPGRSWFGPRASDLTTFASTLLLPPDVRVLPGGVSPARSGGLAVSRDGTQVAFAGLTGGRLQIFARAIDSPVARPVAGTEGGTYPVWSPDGRRIAFFHAGKLKQVPSEGGSAQDIADMPNPRSAASWGPDDTLLFHSGYRGPLSRVAATGGPVTEVLPAMANNLSWFSPAWLPDGRRFLVIRFAYSEEFADRAGIYAGSIDSKDLTLIVPGRVAEVAFGNDEIFFRKGAELIAQPFDPTTLKLSGKPRVLSTHASMIAAGGPTLVYFDPPGGLSQGNQVAWFSRSGALLSNTGTPASFRDPRISPDGRSLAVARADENGLFSIWKYDIARNIDSRISGPTLVAPIWSRDGRSILVASLGLFRLDAGAFGPPHPVRASKEFATLMELSPDGREALVTSSDLGKQTINAVPLDGSADPRPISAETFEVTPRVAFSPDGKWIAVSAVEGSTQRLNVRPYPGPGDRIPVTAMPARFPRWRGDGRELFFLSQVDGQTAMMTSPVTWEGGVPDFGATQMLFKVPRLFAVNFAFDVTKDGQRFVAVIAGDPDPSPLTLVVRAAVR